MHTRAPAGLKQVLRYLRRLAAASLTHDNCDGMALNKVQYLSPVARKLNKRKDGDFAGGTTHENAATACQMPWSNSVKSCDRTKHVIQWYLCSNTGRRRRWSVSARRAFGLCITPALPPASPRSASYDTPKAPAWRCPGRRKTAIPCKLRYYIALPVARSTSYCACACSQSSAQ